MGKQGPCRHCGVTSTPLWRNGPPEKPVLCNACGSRWRTKGSLTNYTPLHSREFDPEEPIVPKVRSIYLKPREQKPFQKKQSTFHVKIEQETPYTDQNFRRSFEGDTSNRSSSGSAISYSESCVHFCATDASDLTGSAQSNVWDSLVPSKKRTCFPRPTPSPVEKLTMDLHSILHEQQSSNLSVLAEEDLLYGCETPMGSVEIDNGGVLIRYPNSKTVEEESEASSLPIDNKSYLINEAYSGSRSFLIHDEVEGTSFSNAGIEKLKKPTSQVAREHVKRDKVSREKLDILRASNSPLSSIDLKDIASFEVFMKHMTCEEQQQLMRFLPFTDNVKPPESLKSMFRSPQFIETLSYFQQLLREGVFDLSSGGNVEERRTLKRLVLLNLTKSKWLGHYKKLKDVKKQIAGASKIATGPNFCRPFDLTPLKRHRGSQNQHCQELKGTMRCPRKVSKFGNVDLPSTKPSMLNCSDAGSELICNTDDLVDEDNGACFSPRTIFASPPDRSSMLGSLQFTDESSDQDLLLDVPCNSSSSFPDAQLLFNPWNQSTAQIRDGLYNNQPSSFTSQNQRH